MSETGIDRRIACEKAYRRGGVHVARMAVEALVERLPLCPENDVVIPRLRAEAEAWLHLLDDWRNSVDEHGTMIAPPGVEGRE